MALSYKINMTTGTQIEAGNIASNDYAVYEYLYNQSGPLSTIGGGEATGIPHILVMFSQADNVSYCSVREISRFSPNELLPIHPRLSRHVSFRLAWSRIPSLGVRRISANVSSTDNYLLLGSALLSTSPRGNMTITSADSWDPPIISPNWLLDDGDAEQAVAPFSASAKSPPRAALSKANISPARIWVRMRRSSIGCGII